MNRVLTPKTLARAIGVSESSLKRWADDGMVQATRTVGGHRRIPLSEAVRFIRAIGATVVRPDLLGLTDVEVLGSDFTVSTTDPKMALHQALEAGDGPRVRGIVQSLYLSGWTVPQICDGPVREAMIQIGKLWLHNEWGIVVEHRATDICVQAVNQLRLLLPSRTTVHPGALGCALDDDPTIIPSLMAAATVAEIGFADVNLGPVTPTRTLLNAVDHYKPKLVWVCVSLHASVNARITGLNTIGQHGKAAGISVIAGGAGLEGISQSAIPSVTIAQSMNELAAFAKGVLATLPPVQHSPMPPSDGLDGPGGDGDGEGDDDDE